MSKGRVGGGRALAWLWFVAMVMTASTVQAEARVELPLEVRIDLTISQVERALIAEDHQATLAALAELRTLAPDLDMPDLLFYEARALAATDVPAPALARLLEFLSAAPRDSGVYADALALLPELETVVAQREAADARRAKVGERLAEIEQDLARLEAESASARREVTWAESSLVRVRRELSDFRAQVQSNCREDWQLYNAGRLMRLGRHATRDECVQDQYTRWGALRDYEDAIAERRRELELAQAQLRPHNERIHQLQSERAQLQAERGQP